MTKQFETRSSPGVQSYQKRLLTTCRRKNLYETNDEQHLVLSFKDEAPTQEKEGASFLGKGSICNRLSEMFMHRLQGIGIETHFIRRLNMSEQLIRRTHPLSFYLRIQNVVDDELAKCYDLPKGEIFPQPFVRLFYKNRQHQQTLLSPENVFMLGLAEEEELEYMMAVGRRVNDFLNGHFYPTGLRLIAFNLEFGRLQQEDLFETSRLIIIDEISPDTLTLMDINAQESYDESDPGPENLADRYQELARRFGILQEGGPVDLRGQPSIHSPNRRN